MKTSLPLHLQILSSIRSKRKADPASRKKATETLRSRGEVILRLQESQHHVIIGLFRINIAGALALLMIFLGFTLFLITEPASVPWTRYLMGVVDLFLLAGLLKMVREFQAYRGLYGEIQSHLREMLRPETARLMAALQPGGGAAESRLVTPTKPKEYQGWDAKHCQNCQKAIDMLATVCQHCGQEQKNLLVN